MSDISARLNAALEGRYVIERELGAGGMATVFLADDVRHERKVALKLLKPELAAVVGAERFLAEIKTTANLQHPNILPLFDSGEADGFLFYVMPYVEGETLKDRLDREKQLPVDEAVAVATAIAGALQTAHERGVVHRDIKPANILLSGGQPLVADFGIALAIGAGGGARLTETGLSVGTPYYMSPEQATGDQHVGARSDIYSLAAMLYEMLTGDPPYVGSTAQAVLGKILQGEPVSATAVRKSIPVHVDAAIRRALEKLPADRFAGAQEFARALADPGFRHGHRGGPDAGSGPGATLWKRLAIGFAVTTAVLAGFSGWALSRPPAPREPVRVALALDPAPFVTGQVPNQIALSPDGTFLVYAASARTNGLWLRRLQELESVFIAGTEGGYSPVISPDGRSIAFISSDGLSLRTAPVAGGAARTLAEDVACCITWADDGFLYYDALDFSMWRVPAAGGTPEAIDPGDALVGLGPVPIQDGAVALFTTAALADPELRATRLATGEVTTIHPGLVFARSLPWGDLVALDEAANLVVAPFDAAKLEVTGPPVPVLQGITLAPSSHFTTSSTGALVYVSGSSGSSPYQPVWVDRSGQVEPVDPEWFVSPATAGANPGLSISPDGSRVAITIMPDAAADLGDIYVKRLPDGAFSRLTTDRGEQARPRWTTDGRSVTYISSDSIGDNLELMVQRADGIGAPELLAGGAGLILEGAISANGWTVMRIGNASLADDVGIVAMAPGEDTVSVRIDSEFLETAFAVSPDGRWIAHESNETGRKEVYIRSFPDPDLRKEQVSVAGGQQPVWGRSGRELFFVNGAREMVAVEVSSDDGLRIGAATTLFRVPDDIFLDEINFYALYDVDVDDQRFMMLRSTSGGTEVVLVLNWFDEIQRLIGR